MIAWRIVFFDGGAGQLGRLEREANIMHRLAIVYIKDGCNWLAIIEGGLERA